MYILNKNGSSLFKTEDFVEISLVDETDRLKKLHPAIRGQYFVVRAYRELNNRNSSVTLASYDEEAEAKENYYAMIEAIGNNAEVFSFYPLNTDMMQERDMQNDMTLED